MWSGHMTVPLHVSSRASGATRFRLRLSTLVAKCHHRTPVAPYPTGRRPLIFKILVTSRLSHRGRLRAPQPHVLAHTTSAGAGRSRNQPVKNLVAATRTAARRELLLGYCAREDDGRRATCSGGCLPGLRKADPVRHPRPAEPDEHRLLGTDARNRADWLLHMALMEYLSPAAAATTYGTEAWPLSTSCSTATARTKHGNPSCFATWSDLSVTASLGCPVIRSRVIRFFGVRQRPPGAIGRPLVLAPCARPDQRKLTPGTSPELRNLPRSFGW
jgi:hypothetical protein